MFYCYFGIVLIYLFVSDACCLVDASAFRALQGLQRREAFTLALRLRARHMHIEIPTEIRQLTRRRTDDQPGGEKVNGARRGKKSLTSLSSLTSLLGHCACGSMLPEAIA